MESLKNNYDKLIESLELLSQPYVEQKNQFESFVDVPFEVIDTFEDSFRQLPNLVENNMLLNNQIAEIIRLHNLINFTLTNPKFKDLNEEEFANTFEWNNIRIFASEIQQLFIK